MKTTCSPLTVERIPALRVARAIGAALLLVGFWLTPLPAQTAAPVPPTTSEAMKEIVALPSFNVSSERDTSYTGGESVSLTRTGVKLSDLPQSVTVVNKSFMDAVSPTGINWMVQYVGGGQVGNLPMYETTDRFAIRGFTSQGDFVDGFLMINAEAATTNFIDHMEIVKGPAAIMSTNASGVVGGAVNKVSVSPVENQSNTLSVEVGRFDAGQATLDVGGAITNDKKLLWRLLLLGADQKGYFDYQYLHRIDFIPMLRYKFSDKTDGWIKAEVNDVHYGSYNGLPLDGRTNQPIAVPVKTNLGENKPLNWRHGFPMWRTWGQFTTRPNDHLAIRFAAQSSVLQIYSTESQLSPSGATTPTLQANGTFAYAPFVQYSVPPTYVPGQLLPRITAATFTDTPHREVQNDYAFNFDTGPVSHKLLAGIDLSDFPAITRSWSNGGSSTATSSSIDPFNFTHPGTVSVNYNQTPVSFQDTSQTYAKIFLTETAGFMHDRVLVSGGLSRHRFDQSQVTYPFNQVTGVAGATVLVPDTSLYKNVVQYGLVVKPMPNLSVFYGRNANFTANGIQNGNFLPPQQGVQKETGIKTDLIPGRVNFAVSYFEIFQINNTVPAFPQTSPQTQVLIPGETSRGFDGDFTFGLTKNLSLIGSFAVFKAHVQQAAPFSLAPQPYDKQPHNTVPVNNVSQNNFTAILRYVFTDPTLKGLSINLASSTLSKRAVTDNSNQIFYTYLPGYTLVNLTAIYETKRYKFQLNVDNLFDKFYWFAARSNQLTFPGTPVNPRLTVTYKF